MPAPRTPAPLRGAALPGPDPLTFAEALAARPSPPHPTAPRANIVIKSSWDRVRATIRNTGARVHTRPAVPGTPARFTVEAVTAACTYYEDLFNNGQAFGGQPHPRGGTISTGPPRTLAEAIASRPSAGLRRPQRLTMPRSLVERADATLRALLEITDGTRIGPLVPRSRHDLYHEAVTAACTYYEDVLNDGKQFAPALRGIAIPGPDPLTFAEALAARTPPPASQRAVIGLVTSWDRVRATVRGAGARAYYTRIGATLPRSLTEFTAEAVTAACTYYEDLLNNGQAFSGQPTTRRDGAARGGVTVAGAPLTLAEITASRPGSGTPRAGTVNLPRSVTERADTTLTGILARSAGTRIAGLIPRTRNDLYREAIEAACTYYEDLLNHGEPFEIRYA